MQDSEVIYYAVSAFDASGKRYTVRLDCTRSWDVEATRDSLRQRYTGNGRMFIDFITREDYMARTGSAT